MPEEALLPPGADLAVYGEPFYPDPPHTILEAFAGSPAAMFGYLFIGDEFWPKHLLDLCAQGRNALIDLDRGPGTSWELGLVGAAWDAHAHTVALTNPFERLAAPLEGSRWLGTWGVVSDGETERLRAATRVRMGQGSAADREELADLVRWLGRRPRAPKDLVGDAARRLQGALLGKLVRVAGRLEMSFEGYALGDSQADLFMPDARPAPAIEPVRDRWSWLGSLDGDPAGRDARILAFADALERVAEGRGRLFPFRRFDAFRKRVIAAFADAKEQSALAQKRREARVAWVLFGEEPPAEAALDKTEPTLAALRKEGEAEGRLVEEARDRLSLAARPEFAERVRPMLERVTGTDEAPLVAMGAFYFATRHLAETRSGFTHVALARRLDRPAPARVWDVEQVLGYFYANPLADIVVSAPVETVALDPRVVGAQRRYRWLAVRVPARFEVAAGKTVRPMSLQNFFMDLKQRLRDCPRFSTSPGFYYSAMSWMTNNSHDRAVLAPYWRSAEHRGFVYPTLVDPPGLDGLKGKVLLVPVREHPEQPVGDRCPR